MGSAILDGILASTSSGTIKSSSDELITNFIVTVHSSASAKKLETKYENYKDHLTVQYGENLSAMKEADIVLLACKPCMAEKVLRVEGVAKALEGKLLISLLAGTTDVGLWKSIGSDSSTIIRAMPNTAAQIREGATVISLSGTRETKDIYVSIAEWIFKKVGAIQYVAEDVFHAGSVVAGATGAFLTVAFEGILDGAVAEGLKRGQASEILAQALLGMAKLIQAGEHPSVLREKVSSPRGTTIAGLLRLEKEGVRSGFAEATIDAIIRAENMS